jgi:catechol 2,3-dioxygenase-like lactoylglutathione lyase family enzyme
MFAYVCLGTNDLERATRFYDAALTALGLTRCVARDFESDTSWAGCAQNWRLREGGLQTRD